MALPVNVLESEQIADSDQTLYGGIDSDMESDIGVCVTLDLAEVEQVEPVSMEKPMVSMDKKTSRDATLVSIDRLISIDKPLVPMDKALMAMDNMDSMDKTLVSMDKIISMDKSLVSMDTMVSVDKTLVSMDKVVTMSEGLELNKDEKTIDDFFGHADIEKSGAMQIAQEPAGMANQKQECAGCKKTITDRFLLKALDQYWHEDCLKCSCCDCRLGEVGSTLFAKANLLLCRRDYLRLFGTTGYCSACSKMIPAFEMVMRAKNNVYHLECFACQMCNHRFCVGDRFYLCDNKILCEYDYEERMVFANMTYNYNALTQIKRQTNSLSDDLSSGYGSPSPGSL